MTFARYTLLRFMLLFAVLIVLWLVGARGFWLIVLALVISVPLSYFVLKGPRLAMTQQLADRMASRAAGSADPDADAEDAEAEDAEAEDAEDAEAEGAAIGSAEGEGQRDQNAEGELGAPGVAQGGDELPADPTTDDGPDGGQQEHR